MCIMMKRMRPWRYIASGAIAPVVSEETACGGYTTGNSSSVWDSRSDLGRVLFVGPRIGKRRSMRVETREGSGDTSRFL